MTPVIRMFAASLAIILPMVPATADAGRGGGGAFSTGVPFSARPSVNMRGGYHPARGTSPLAWGGHHPSWGGGFYPGTGGGSRWRTGVYGRPSFAAGRPGYWNRYAPGYWWSAGWLGDLWPVGSWPSGGAQIIAAPAEAPPQPLLIVIRTDMGRRQTTPATPTTPPDFSYVAGCHAIPNGYHCDGGKTGQ